MILQLENVTRKFGGLTAVNEVSFGVDNGQIVGLIGPNGSGKTTCFNLITGFCKLTSGKITFGGKDITDLPAHVVAEEGIARTFQISSVFPALTALDNIITAHHSKLKANMITGLFKVKGIAEEENEAVKKSYDLLDFVGLKQFSNTKAGSLTSADQRRLMVAIALATKPKLLLLDEPCAGMNHDEQVELIKLIRRVCDTGMPVLLVEHHMKMIMEVCDKVVVLNLGKKIAEGKPRDVQNNKAVVEAYLGRSGVVDA